MSRERVPSACTAVTNSTQEQLSTFMGRFALRFIAGLAVAASVMSASAIDLEFNFVPTGTLPGNDSDGSRLMTLFAYAEHFYEDAFPGGDFTSSVGVTYAELNALNALGLYTPAEQLIRIDPTPSTMWFIDDESPEDNSEFDMQQVLWRDLSEQQ